jgi:hypothetical protein
MIENDTEWNLTPYRGDDSAKDAGHAQQGSEASAESDCAERGECNQNGHSQAEANEHLGRFQLLR